MIWLIGILCFVIGLIIGAVLFKQLKSDALKVEQLEEQLTNLQSEYDHYKNDVHSHFSGAAQLADKLTESYREVYRHLAAGAHSLCPENISSQLFLSSQNNDLISGNYSGDTDDSNSIDNNTVGSDTAFSDTSAEVGTFDEKEAEALAGNEAEAPDEKETETLAGNEAEAPDEKETGTLAENEAEAPDEKETGTLAENEAEAPDEKETETLAGNEAEALAGKEAEALAEREAVSPAEDGTAPPLFPPRDYADKSDPDQIGSLNEDYGLDKTKTEATEDTQNKAV